MQVICRFVQRLLQIASTARCWETMTQHLPLLRQKADFSDGGA
ncbi:hypothetical protein ACZ87_01860 [Candidatus Erwinia dacicola]|uniref:Uncharacterized protein n=1 Tax=Candidatus Erwinia dacicola TaxID=252393 RepID=A0A328TPA9_9GAMM|nr:hypothetical protein ACZ87_01860 [Candidatus Erwinia dacicola]